MLLRHSAFLLLIFCGSFAYIEGSFENYMIVPTYLTTAPSSFLSVRYNNIVVNYGNEVPGFVTHYPPYVSYEANITSLYAYVFVDLDRPSSIAPTESPYLHQLVINIPGANIASGEFITAYLPPAPYPGSGYHRFLFLIYKQSSYINMKTSDRMRIQSDPGSFSLFKFSSEYDLGSPIAGNFFTTQLIVCCNSENTSLLQPCS